MTFVSYAQNLEDVMLRRVFGGQSTGFWVDIGAQHPFEDSVTHAFHLLGWRGLNVEPVPRFHELLQRHRPEDINVDVVVSNEYGVVEFYEVAETGLSTMSKDSAELYRRDGFEVIVHQRTAMRLDDLLARHDIVEVDFMKIDVEGAERAVLEGLDLLRTRPLVLIIEATEPNSTTRTDADWAHLVVRAGYREAYFDGLNCFFVPTERDDLARLLMVPPNVHDDFIRAREQRLALRLDEPLWRHVARRMRRVCLPDNDRG